MTDTDSNLQLRINNKRQFDNLKDSRCNAKLILPLFLRFFH